LRKTRKGFKSLRSIVAARAREINAQNFFDPDRNVTVNHSSAAAAGRRGFRSESLPSIIYRTTVRSPYHQPPATNQPIPTDPTVACVYTIYRDTLYIIFLKSLLLLYITRDSGRFRRRTHFGTIMRNI